MTIVSTQIAGPGKSEERCEPDGYDESFADEDGEMERRQIHDADDQERRPGCDAQGGGFEHLAEVRCFPRTTDSCGEGRAKVRGSGAVPTRGSPAAEPH